MQLVMDQIYGVAQRNVEKPSSIIISSGTVDIYVSNADNRPTSSSDTTWVKEVASASGTYHANGYPKYMYVTAVSGTPVVHENNVTG